MVQKFMGYTALIRFFYQPCCRQMVAGEVAAQRTSQVNIWLKTTERIVFKMIAE
jgi:hypothetical protein